MPEMLAGQDAPVVDNEAQNLTPEQFNSGTTDAQTDGADGGKESPVPRTYSEEELRERIERATAKAAAKAERRAFREATERLTSQSQRAEPKREAYANDDAYRADQQQFLIRQEAEKIIKEREETERSARVHDTFIEKAEAAADRFPDFHSVVTNPNVPFNDDMLEFFADSDVGADLAYQLAKKPSQVVALRQMSPLKAARELTRLEAEIRAKPKAAPSKAPDPIRPVGTRGSTSSTTLPSDEDDIGTWMKKEEARTRRR